LIPFTVDLILLVHNLFESHLVRTSKAKNGGCFHGPGMHI